MVYLDRYSAAASHCLALPASLDQVFSSESHCSSMCATTEVTPPGTLDLCLVIFLVPSLVYEREGVDTRRRRINWKCPKVQQPSATDRKMAIKGVCTLLGVLILVNSSCQQQGRRKPLKKGAVQHGWIPQKQNLSFAP